MSDVDKKLKSGIDKERDREFCDKAQEESREENPSVYESVNVIYTQLKDLEERHPEKDNIMKQIIDLEEAKAFDLPLMINREWFSEDIKEKYIEILKNIQFPEEK